MPAVIAPGNHDGVHLGHRALIQQASSLAAQLDCNTVALTFDPHPEALLSPELAPPLLTSMARRVELLRGVGADEVFVQTFDRAFASLSAETFVESLLVETLQARGLVVGPDFRFGAGAKGDVSMLQRLGQVHGFQVIVVPPVQLNGDRVSSSRVRASVSAGDLPVVTRMLSRVHEVQGLVTRGDGRGRSLGFATANLQCEPTLQPPDGVYAVVARVVSKTDPATISDEPLLHGVCNLGVRPTFGAGRSVEVHLLDFGGDLYGKQLRVGFVARVRGEQKFAGIDALRAQIDKDIHESRDALGRAAQEDLTWI